MLRFLAVLCLVLIRPAWPHTYHASIAQIDHRTAARTLEIMLFIHAEDMERLMKRRGGPSASLDRQKEAERLVFAYLKETFLLRDGSGRMVPLKWVGLEVRTHFLVAYMEAPSAGFAAMTIDYRTLLDELPDQSNTVMVKEDGEERRQIVFDRSGPGGPVPVASLRTR
jgi:hypothetical protein